MIAQHSTRTRRGLFLIEIVGALLVITIALGLLGVTVARGVTAGRELAHRSWAIQESRNAMERIDALPDAALNPSTARAAIAACEQRVQRLLRDGSISVTLSEPDNAGLVRVSVLVEWTGAGDQPVKPVRLIAWRDGGSSTEASR